MSTLSQCLIYNGYIFTPAQNQIDFSAIADFDLAKLNYILHKRSGAFVYARDRPDYRLREVDGVAMPLPPTVGKVLVLGADCSDMFADDKLEILYDAPAV